MSFNEDSLFQIICAAGQRGTEIEGFFYSGAGGETGLGTRMVNECQGLGQTNVVIHYMGMPVGGSGWRLHHNKFFMVDYGVGNDVELAFGSANLSTQGLSVNYENWNFFRAQRTFSFIQDHLCDVSAMRAARLAGVLEDDEKVFRTELEKCLVNGEVSPGKAEEVLARDGVVSFFSPDPKDHAFTVLEDQIKRVVPGGRIRMAVYFFMHKPLLTALTDAVARGVEVQLVVDDDIYLGGSIPTQRRFWRNYLKPDKSGFKVRSFDTNEEIYQLQHNKFLVLEGVDTLEKVRVFSGAGQFTLAAFKNNYENFFLVSDPAVVAAYQDLYLNLWNLGADVLP